MLLGPVPSPRNRRDKRSRICRWYRRLQRHGSGAGACVVADRLPETRAGFARRRLESRLFCAC
jgi:hypothetical protein